MLPVFHARARLSNESFRGRHRRLMKRFIVVSVTLLAAARASAAQTASASSDTIVRDTSRFRAAGSKPRRAGHRATARNEELEQGGVLAAFATHQDAAARSGCANCCERKAGYPRRTHWASFFAMCPATRGGWRRRRAHGVRWLERNIASQAAAARRRDLKSTAYHADTCRRA